MSTTGKPNTTLTHDEIKLAQKYIKAIKSYETKVILFLENVGNEITDIVMKAVGSEDAQEALDIFTDSIRVSDDPINIFGSVALRLSTGDYTRIEFQDDPTTIHVFSDEVGEQVALLQYLLLKQQARDVAEKISKIVLKLWDEVR